MPKQREGIYEKILECAKKEFLEKGFSDASLRSIAAMADTTTGTIYSRFGGKEGLFSALVEPVADYIINLFLKTQETFHSIEPEEQPHQMDKYVTGGMMAMLDYIYEHFQEFSLLLDASYGTKFQNFVETLVEIETEYTYKYMEDINFQGEESEVITEEFIHIMTRALFESMFEVVRHKMPKEQAVKYMNMLAKFHYGGWGTILDLE
ncbi:MAG: TetR/AcrR family transcriptional regulator [Eubacterium sp.]|nr:TetR/AcrR family transcriptional regulator [Eubacterium sp.]